MFRRSLAIRRSKEVTEDTEKKAISEPFTFEDKLGMSLNELKARWKADAARTGRGLSDNLCAEMVKTITNCHYGTTIKGVGASEHAIFVGDKLAAIVLSYDYHYSDWAVISGIRVPVNIKQAMIDAFGPPEIIQGCCYPALTDSELRALHWDNGRSVLEYQPIDCVGDNDYERIVRVLQKRYCENGNLAIAGYSNILYIDKTLSSLLMTRWKKAEEDARKKARSDM